MSVSKVSILLGIKMDIFDLVQWLADNPNSCYSRELSSALGRRCDEIEPLLLSRDEDSFRHYIKYSLEECKGEMVDGEKIVILASPLHCSQYFILGILINEIYPSSCEQECDPSIFYRVNSLTRVLRRVSAGKPIKMYSLSTECSCCE